MVCCLVRRIEMRQCRELLGEDVKSVVGTGSRNPDGERETKKNYA